MRNRTWSTGTWREEEEEEEEEAASSIVCLIAILRLGGLEEKLSREERDFRALGVNLLTLSLCIMNYLWSKSQRHYRLRRYLLSELFILGFFLW